MKKVAQLTDIHLDEDFPKEQGINCRDNWNRILEDLAVKGINEIIFTGDIGEDESLSWFFNSLEERKINYKVIIGNHDRFEEVIKHYQNEFLNGHKELFYSFETDIFKYIFLDSSTEKISDSQFAWFQEQLADVNKEVMLFIHHPILDCGLVMDKKYPLAGREKLVDLLTNVDQNVYVFSGHYHIADERTFKNIEQFVTPSAAFQVKRSPDEIEIDNIEFGYRIITIDDNNSIDSEVIKFERR